ncbi:MAG: glyoxylate/hydroxypyruvate reductase A [Burkholderiaceae bacterium]|nr:glyoxylate/hydroxypyruvate reductase A [Burkholderiaceae bacterium]MDO9090732.1 glyoxylate/hydroxypyruvate reductase A [Burkholderiaceae bacterium]MDP1968197.1 glyoxylate/hydroxypyruvate reductase A [Burkholderiaceae bacterium]
MRIVFCSLDARADDWLQSLRDALPDAQVQEWAPGAPPAEYAVVWRAPQQFFDAQPGLRCIFNMGAGVDALLGLRLPPGAALVRLEDGGMGVQMAEYVCHAVIRHFREMERYEESQRAGQWALRKPLRRADFPVGIMGLGVLGASVARALAQFGFPLAGWSRTPKSMEGLRCYAGAAQFDEFLAATRILVCMLPLTPQTRDIMRRETLSRLLPGSYIVNVARGEHLVEEDLLALIDEGRIEGAALDVFRTEPLPAQHPFWQHPRIRVTPHSSARTLRDETVAQIAAKIRALQRGEAVSGKVDLQRGY